MNLSKIEQLVVEEEEGYLYPSQNRAVAGKKGADNRRIIPPPPRLVESGINIRPNIRPGSRGSGLLGP
jgi:hypothetical protein